MADTYPMRINKYLAHQGHATRRDADVLIQKGLVDINGKKAVLGDKVKIGDKVEVRSHKKRQYRYFAYNKPVGVVTHSPQLGEQDVVTAASIRDVFPIGRLDKASRGLLILTDDARVTDKLLNPEYVHEKEYRVTVREPLPLNFKKRMESGIDIEGYMTKPCTVDIKGEKKFTIVLTEGKKHQIRRMCDKLGVGIVDLERIRVMNVRLGSLGIGARRAIAGAELAQFVDSLGLKK